MVVPSPFVVLPSGATRHNRDLLISEPTLVSSRPQVVVYRIRAKARWNDGMPISAADYILHWRTHTARGCPRCSPGEVAGYSQIASVVGSDNGKTVTVTFASEYPRWRALFCHLLPAHQATQRFPVPARVPGGGPLAPPPPWVADFSGGPYRVTAVREDQVELAANPRWYGGWAPTLDRVIFRLFRDQASATVAAARGELDGLRVPVVAGTPARIQRLTGMGFTSQVSTGGQPTVLAISPRYVNIRDNNAPGGVFTADAERWGMRAVR
jgi:peptide/nickel transport system substrate-binding protein